MLSDAMDVGIPWRSTRPSLLVAVLYQTVVSYVRANSTATSQSNTSSTIDIVTYSWSDGGSCPTMYRTGSGILGSLAEAPSDASALEEYFLAPYYGTIASNLYFHQKGISGFITVLWILLVLFIIITVVVILLRSVKRCGADDKQKVTPRYMAAYIFYVISLTLLLILGVYFLICLLTTRSSLVYALYETVPDMYAMAFGNLLLFVTMTADEILQSQKRNVPSRNARNFLGDDFEKEFKDFLVRNAMKNSKLSSYGTCRICSNDLDHLDRYFRSKGSTRQSLLLRSLGVQCVPIYEILDKFLDSVARVVDETTLNQRQQLAADLVDTNVTSSANDTDAEPSVTSINKLRESIAGFEQKHGLYSYLSGTLMFWLLCVLVVFFVSLALLSVCLVVGVATHRPSIKSHDRSSVSHFTGYLHILAAYCTALFVLLALPTVICLIAYSALGECYFCAPVRQDNLALLDESFEKLWPASQRGYILSKLAPSELFSKCQNESVSVFELRPKPTKPRAFHRHGVFTAHLDSQTLLQKIASHDGGGILQDDDAPNMYASRSMLSLVSTMFNSSSQSQRNLRGVSETLLEKCAHFLDEFNNTKIMRTALERLLLPAIPSYFWSFVDQVTAELNDSSPLSQNVIGPCFIAYSLLASLIDVVCKIFLQDLIGHWAALLFAVFVSMLIIIGCFLLSKYYFRTLRKRRSKGSESRKRQSRKTSTNRHRKTRNASTSTEKTTESGSSPEMTRRIIIRSAVESSTLVRPYPWPIRRGSSITCHLGQTSLRNGTPPNPFVLRLPISRPVSPSTLLLAHPSTPRLVCKRPLDPSLNLQGYALRRTGSLTSLSSRARSLSRVQASPSSSYLRINSSPSRGRNAFVCPYCQSVQSCLQSASHCQRMRPPYGCLQCGCPRPPLCGSAGPSTSQCMRACTAAASFGTQQVPPSVRRSRSTSALCLAPTPTLTTRLISAASSRSPPSPIARPGPLMVQPASQARASWVLILNSTLRQIYFTLVS